MKNCLRAFSSTGPLLGLTHQVEPLMKLVIIGKRSRRTLGDLQQTAGIGTRTILMSGIREILVRLVFLFSWRSSTDMVVVG